MQEKIAHDFGRAPERFESSRNTLLEIGESLYQHAPYSVVLYMVPYLFVGVEFRRIWRQVEYPQTSLGGSHILLNLCGPVDRMAVDNDIDRFVAVMKQPLKEVDEGARCHIFLRDHEVQRSPWR